MTGAQEAVDRILDRGGPDADVLQGVVDSDQPAAFGDDDCELLERISVQISRAVA